MTDRDNAHAEVSGERLDYRLRDMGIQCCDIAADRLAALREMLEAAENARDQWMLTYHSTRDTLNAQLTEARAQLDAEWNAAIEAAAIAAETTPDEIVGTMELTPSQYVVADAIRALRRPAKTAGEGE